MYALISPEETQIGYNQEILGSRIVQIEEKVFDVAQPLFWIEYEPITEQGILYYSDGKIKLEPISNNIPPPSQRIYQFKEVEL